MGKRMDGWVTVHFTMSPPALAFLSIANNYQNSFINTYFKNTHTQEKKENKEKGEIRPPQKNPVLTTPFKVSYPIAILTRV